jgi:hypothetical protein
MIYLDRKRGSTQGQRAKGYTVQGPDGENGSKLSVEQR